LYIATPKPTIPPAKTNTITIISSSSSDDNDDDEEESDDDSSESEDEKEPVPKPAVSSEPQKRVASQAAKSLVSESLAKSEESVEDNEEIQSQNTSTRDSRSPVVFSSSKAERRGTTTIKIEKRSPSPESESESEDGGEEVSSESGEEQDKDRDATVKSSVNAIEDVDMQSEFSSDEDEEEEAEIQIPKSSPPPSLPALKSAIKPTVNSRNTESGINPKGNNSKDSNSDSGQDTQDEVDQQLTSSLFEVLHPSSSAIRSSAITSSSTATRPKFGLGASLSSLNANKPLFGSQGLKPTSSRPQLKELDEDEEEESEEESEDDESSDDEEAPKQAALKQDTPSKDTKKTQDSGSDSFSASDTSSDSESEEDDDPEKTIAENIRNELSQSIKGLESSGFGGINSSTPSKRPGTDSSQSSAKRVDKSVSRHVFQPYGKFS